MRSKFSRPLRRTRAMVPSQLVNDDNLLQAKSQPEKYLEVIHSARTADRQKKGIGVWITGFVIAAAATLGALDRASGDYSLSPFFHEHPSAANIFETYDYYEQAYTRARFQLPRDQVDKIQDQRKHVALINEAILQAQRAPKPTYSSSTLTEQLNERLTSALSVALTQEQYEALAQIVKRDGMTRFLGSELMASLNDADYMGAYLALTGDPDLQKVFGLGLEPEKMESLVDAYKTMGSSSVLAAQLKAQVGQFAQTANMSNPQDIARMGELLLQYSWSMEQARQSQQIVMQGYKGVIRELGQQITTNPSEAKKSQIQFLSNSHERVQANYEIVKHKDLYTHIFADDLIRLSEGLSAMSDPSTAQQGKAQAQSYLFDIVHEISVADAGATHKNVMSMEGIKQLNEVLGMQHDSLYQEMPLVQTISAASKVTYG